MMEECAVCLGKHDGEYHESVRRIRRWMLRRIADATPPVIVPRTRTYRTGMGDIHSLRSPSAKRKQARK